MMGTMLWSGKALPKPPRECLKIWHQAERWQQSLEFSILLGIHLPMGLLRSCELIWVDVTPRIPMVNSLKSQRLPFDCDRGEQRRATIYR